MMICEVYYAHNACTDISHLYSVSHQPQCRLLVHRFVCTHHKPPPTAPHHTASSACRHCVTMSPRNDDTVLSMRLCNPSYFPRLVEPRCVTLCNAHVKLMPIIRVEYVVAAPLSRCVAAAAAVGWRKAEATLGSGKVKIRWWDCTWKVFAP